MTVELDVTDFAAVMRASTRKTYLAQLWAIAAVVNRHEEFRMCLTESGQPAVWDEIDPSFTVFNKERETFSCVWAPYDPDFGIFHAAADGFHVSRLVNELQELLTSPEWVGGH